MEERCKVSYEGSRASKNERKCRAIVVGMI